LNHKVPPASYSTIDWTLESHATFLPSYLPSHPPIILIRVIHHHLKQTFPAPHILIRVIDLPSSSHDYMTMATLSHADIETILDALCDGLLKRLSYIDPPSVEIDSHDIDGILKRFTSVDALVMES